VHDGGIKLSIELVSVLQWEGVNLVQMGWSVFEDLQCAAEDGTVYVYTIHGDLKRMITTGQVHNNFLYITKYHFYGKRTGTSCLIEIHFSIETTE
jgi:hypothetical protein